MKKGPLSNQEKEYIKSNLEMDVKELAVSMDRSTKIVDNFVVKCLKEKHYIKPKRSEVQNLMARSPERGVVVMTEAASMKSDEQKKKPQAPRRYTNIIHQIKGD